MRDVAIATALGPMAVAGLLAAHRVRPQDEPAASDATPGGDAGGAGPAHTGDGGSGGPTPPAPGARTASGGGLPGARAAGAAREAPGPSEPPAAGGGVHAGRDIRVENQGSGAAVGQAHIVNNYQVTQSAVRLPYRIGRVPALAAPFQERGIPELDAADPAGGPPLVLAGMFGTGKTQLAARFAESAWERGDLHLLLWVDASSREAVLSAYARAGQDLIGRTYADAADGAQAFLNWLRPAGGTQPHPWLVVLDGVTDPAHLTGLWPPASPGGRVLVTSARADVARAGGPQVVVRVRPFSRDEVRAYLERALELDPAAGPADTAGFVSASVTEIVRGGLALDTYLATRASAASGKDDAGPTPVQRSIEAAAATAPEGVARAVLAVTTLMGGGWVPEDILLTEPARRQVAFLADRKSTKRAEERYAAPVRPQAAPYRSRSARASAMPLGGEEPAVPAPAHGGAVPAGAEWRVSSPYGGPVPIGAEEPAAPAPADGGPVPAGAEWRVPSPYGGPAPIGGEEPAVPAPAHGGAVPAGAEWRVSSPYGGSVPIGADAVRTALRALYVRGLVDREEHGAVRLVRVVEGVRWASLDWAPEMYLVEGLPVLRGLWDAVAEAWPDSERGPLEARLLRGAVWALSFSDAVVDGREVVYLPGPDGVHPLAFRYGRSLGAWGRYAAAEEHFRDLALTAAGTFGADHPDVLRALSRAACWRGARGDDFGAVDDLVDVLARQRGVLGEEHPDVLATRYELAVARLSAVGWGTPAPQAELAAVLDGQVRVLGPDHLDTLRTASRIVATLPDRREADPSAADAVTAAAASLLGSEGSEGSDGPGDAGAKALAAALHAALVRAAGADHPLTIGALGLRAGVHADRGDDDTALALLERALAEAERALGPEHPVTLNSRSAAALAEERHGGREAVERALRAVREQREKVLGPDDQGTLAVRAALLEHRAGDPAVFADECAELLADTERVFGTDHRRTRQLLDDIATLHEDAERDAAALVALSDLAGRSARVLGPDHPGTLRLRFRVAAARGRQADTLGALTALAALRGDCVRVLGPDHRTTLDVGQQLALNRYVAGDTAGALSDLARLLAAHERVHGPDAEQTREVREDLERMRGMA